jgi:predicted nucleic acid-binding protein
MVVSDTSPLNYLILIEQINLLPQLYTRVLIPRSVLEELNAPETPNLVRTWGVGHPDWLEVSRAVDAPDPELSLLHAGERDAISLALQIKTEALIIDERRGRQEAEKTKTTSDWNTRRPGRSARAWTIRPGSRD